MTIIASPSSIINPFGPLAEELAIVEPRDVPSIVDWAPDHFRLPAKETKLAGPFSFDYSPHLREPCRWFADPFVREITLLAGLQAGKTLFSMLCMAWLIEFAPGPTMVVMTDENTLRRRMKRLRPLFECNPFLLRRLGGRPENLYIGEPTDLGEMLLILAWSNSAATIADYPIQYIFADEIALWAPTVGMTEIDALSQLRGRQNTYERQSKLVKVSSGRNVGDLMDTEWNEGDRCEYWVPCKACRYWHVMRWHDREQKGVYAVLDRDKSGAFLRPRDYEMGRHVRYLCPSCGRAWTDYDRAESLKQGLWLPAGVTMGAGGTVEGTIVPTAYKSAHIHGLMVHPRLRSINKMAAEWVRAQRAQKTGNIGPLKHFLNNQVGQSWKETRAETDETAARRHIGSYRAGTAPVGVQAITVAIDVQVDHLRYAAWGWGYLYECWLIEAGRLETGDTKEIGNYAQARRLIVRPWPMADSPGSVLDPAQVVIDSAYNTEVVLNFCRQNAASGIIPVLGSPRQMSRIYSKVAIDHIVTRYDLNLLPLKDQVHRLLFVTEQPGGGYMHLPGDVSDEIVAEMCSEHKIMKGARPIWVPKAEHLANHTWDLAVYGTVAAMIAGVGTLGPYGPPPPPVEKKDRPKPRTDGFLDGLPDLNG